MMSGFHYHGKPVSPQDVADILRHRKAHRLDKLERLRDFDELHSGLWRQLWAMIRGRLK
nr:hypothetical protein [uncultured Brevundimonas sp.]